jgi:RNA polymerase sigma factor (sigma-70 family)
MTAPRTAPVQLVTKRGHRLGTPLGDHPAEVTALVRAAQGGDEMAKADLVELLLPYVRRWCGPIALEEGSDAAQETLILVLRSLRQLRQPAALFGWARTIAVRESVRVASQRARPAELPDLPAPGDPQLAVDVLDVLHRLAPEHRAILMLRDVDGLTEQQAAELLAIPVGTVKSRLSRARRSFRRAWQQEP